MLFLLFFGIKNTESAVLLRLVQCNLNQYGLMSGGGCGVIPKIVPSHSYNLNLYNQQKKKKTVKYAKVQYTFRRTQKSLIYKYLNQTNHYLLILSKQQHLTKPIIGI